jgi:putative heme-binding domain-containing protein
VVYQVRGYEKRDMTWRIVPNVGLLLMFFGTIGAALCQEPNSAAESAPIRQPELRGKSAFELRCATCHGLDGLGGEHAPDVIRPTAVRTLSDQALLSLIHDGIPERGMPGFSDMGREDGPAVVAYLRFLQGNSAGTSMRGDPIRGRDLFFGKAGCSACHQMAGRGQFIAEDLAGFARDRQVGEIREAILRPTGGEQEEATAVARDGRKFFGMIRNEDNASLQLQDGDGRLYLLMKSSLVSVQRKTGEPMPADYGQRLSTPELDDLVSYILREARAPDVSSSPSGKDEEPHVQN